MAHRQPLYPMLLAACIVLGRDALEDLASLNVALVIAAMWVAYGIAARVLASRTAGVLAAAVVWDVPFLFENATTRLLTEPGYVLCGLLAAWAFLAYARKPSTCALGGVACATGLAYLQRVNGLWLAIPALAALLILDLLDTRRRVAVRAFAARWALATFLCVLVTVPSWAPRLYHARNPFYHGYLPNYLWVDQYERAHVPGPPRYGWRDYVREHDASAALSRLRYGLRRTLWEAPREKYGAGVAAAMLLGAVVVALARDRAALAWLGVGLLQMLPVAWSALANPVRRIPATALLPFGVIAIAAGAAVAIKTACDRRRVAAART